MKKNRDCEYKPGNALHQIVGSYAVSKDCMMSSADIKKFFQNKDVQVLGSEFNQWELQCIELQKENEALQDRITQLMQEAMELKGQISELKGLPRGLKKGQY